MQKLVMGKEFKEAFHAMDQSNDHIFLTGRAGTGKSTLLQYFRSHTKKKHVVLAPTGVAALNVKAQTIHSFFGFHPEIQPHLVRRAFPDALALFRTLETIVIDEISMVRADLLDCIDRALRLNRDRPRDPFGGVQMIFVGDLFQLPPVVTREETYRFETEYRSPYFFSSYSMFQLPLQIIELKKVYRQKERPFINLLEKVRTSTLSPSDVDAWNERHDPSFDPREEVGYIHLTTTNAMARKRNEYELKHLPGKVYQFFASSTGSLPDRRMPSESILRVKEGARIMFTMNDPERRWVNGSLGTIRAIRKKSLSSSPTLKIELENGNNVEVQQHTWEIFAYAHDGNGNLEESIVGSYIQYPLVLAWAVTIHKAQGKTFDRMLIDMGWGAFAHGQMYVALSRCRTFKGIVLLRPFRAQDVILDEAVVNFMKSSLSP